MRWPRLRDPDPAAEAPRQPAPEPAGEESPAAFLSRWSRLKQAVREAETVERPPLESRPPPAVDTVSEPPPGTLPVGTAGGVENGGPHAPDTQAVEAPEPPLPSLDEITAETDISVFLRKGVASAIRNAALRKMWSLDPAIRDYVGDARDYAYDWNTPGGVPGFGPIDAGYDVQGTLEGMFSRPEPEAGEEPQPEPAVDATGEPETEPDVAATEAQTVAADDEAPSQPAGDMVEAAPPQPLEAAPTPASAPDQRGMATLRRGRATPV